MVDSDSDEHNYTFNVTSGCVSRKSEDIQCFSHSFKVPENELIPHTKYSVRIAAVNVNGTGPFSNMIAVLSGDDGEIIDDNNYVHICSYRGQVTTGPAFLDSSINIKIVTRYFNMPSFLACRLWDSVKGQNNCYQTDHRLLHKYANTCRHTCIH